MGKILDFIFSDSWEEYQRIQLFKKLGKKIEELNIEKIDEKDWKLSKIQFEKLKENDASNR